MIDYEQLKIAHELAQHYSIKLGGYVQVSIDFDPDWDEYCDKNYAQCRLISNVYSQSFREINELINRLKELTSD